MSETRFLRGCCPDVLEEPDGYILLNDLYPWSTHSLDRYVGYVGYAQTLCAKTLCACQGRPQPTDPLRPESAKRGLRCGTESEGRPSVQPSQGSGGAQRQGLCYRGRSALQSPDRNLDTVAGVGAKKLHV